MQAHSSLFYKADRGFTDSHGVYKGLLSASNGHARKVLPESFGNLFYMQDVSLKPGQEYVVKRDAAAHQVIVPLIGAFFYSGAEGKHTYVGSQEVLLLPAGIADQRVHNCNTDETINYLHIGLKKETPKEAAATSYPAALREYNKQVSLHLEKVEENTSACAIIYKKRTKDTYQVKTPGHGIFVYVVNGSFMVGKHWLDHRDGLAFWNAQEIVFEALADLSILLIVEVPLIRS